MANGIIFDMDGVVIDSAEHHYDSWQRLAEEHGFAADKDFFRETFGRRNEYIVPLFFGREDMPAEEARQYAERKEELYREIVADKARPMPGLISFMDRMLARGWSLAIGSSAPRVNVEFILEALGLGNKILAYTCAEDVTRGKPDPEVFCKAADKLQLSPAHCVVFEDAVHGIEAAKRAGMMAVALTTTTTAENMTEADLIIESFEGLSCYAVAELLNGR